MINLRVIFFYDPNRFWVKRPTEKLFAYQVYSIYLPDELRYFYWHYCPFKSLSNFEPRNLVVLELSYGGMEYLWNDNHQSLVNLREIYVADCKKLRKIPSLLGAINLEILYCRRFESLVELPCLNHLASLKELELSGCHNLKTFPERLKMSCSSIQKLQCNIILFGSREISTVDVSSPILISETIDRLEMDHCESLKILSELPPYMRNLDARGCTSLEKVSFTDQISYQLDPNDDDDDDVGNKISANKFEHQSTSSSLVLKIAPKGSSGSRFLVFSICLVVDLTLCYYHEYLTFYCECQLKTGSGGDYETFRSQWKSFLNEDSKWWYMGDHVLILFSKDMVKQDKDYEEASFEFYIQNLPSSSEEDEEDEEETEDENIKVEKCGVHVSYVDEETSTTPTT
ncbi:hypothetical protein Gotur_029574 [Gossypium turneri]